MKSTKILITGSAGLIGTALEKELRMKGVETVGVDRKPHDHHVPVDICDIGNRPDLLNGVRGIVHLAAVSRVIDAHRNPWLCMTVNVDATRSLLALAAQSKERPWFIYASSREIYGQQDSLPVHELAPPRPMNVYAESKYLAEQMTVRSQCDGMNSAIVRFSNVYGSTKDHRTRVVPAFTRGAVLNDDLHIEGASNTFDFTFVEDVAKGVTALIGKLDSGETQTHPLHFVSGKQTSLRDLANLVVREAQSRSRLLQHPPRTFDVSTFCGDPEMTRRELGWQASTPLEYGIRSMIAGYRADTVQSRRESLAGACFPF